MNYFNAIYIRVCAGILLLASLSGCDKLIEIPKPITEVSSDAVFSSQKTALAALSGAMSSTTNSLSMAANLTPYTAMAADEVDFLSSSNNEEILRNTYSPLSATNAVNNLNSFWTDMYAGVYRFNSVIEGVAKTNVLSDSLKVQMTANAKFMRALCYFYLVNLYRDVPLVLETDVIKTSLLPKETADKINNQIIADLLAARDVLPANFASVPGARTVITRWAASALLARVYLYTKQWDLAEKEATKVIENSGGLFVMLPKASIQNIFLKNNTEAILQFGTYLNVNSGYTYEGATFATNSAQYSLKETLRNSFAASDLRGTAWVRDTTILGVRSYQPYKFRVTSQTVSTAMGRQEAPTHLRLAEQYLIRAEARLELSRPLDARSDMNVVRVRAGVDGSTSTDPVVLKRELEEENRHEFFCELGHRWFDLRRTARIDAVLGAQKPTWTPKAAYFPLPQVAINANPNLLQNPDYN